MNTQSHILMGALLFGKPLPKLAMAGALGGLVPDLPMFAIVAGLRLSGHRFEEIFGKLYWERWWQVCNAVSHSFLLWGALALISGYMILRTSGASAPKAALLFAFSGAAFVHSCVDFLVHRDDAHMQFWPLSDWKFVSPVSYWDRAHYGDRFGLFEAALGIAMAALLFRRHRSLLTRCALALCMALYAAVPAFFIYNLNGA
jgi:membrane-bound metal-dependent hydrolase YbcI (DUF457 family)